MVRGPKIKANQTSQVWKAFVPLFRCGRSLNSPDVTDAGGEHRPRSDRPGHRRDRRQQDPDGRRELPAHYGELRRFESRVASDLMCVCDPRRGR